RNSFRHGVYWRGRHFAKRRPHRRNHNSSHFVVRDRDGTLLWRRPAWAWQRGARPGDFRLVGFEVGGAADAAKSAWLAGPYPERPRSHGTGILRAVKQGRLSAGVMRKVLFRRRTGARTSLQSELASATRSDRSANIRGRAGAPS